MTAVPAVAAGRRPMGGQQVAVALLLPIALINVVGFMLPIFNLARYSFQPGDGGRGDRERPDAPELDRASQRPVLSAADPELGLRLARGHALCTRPVLSDRALSPPRLGQLADLPHRARDLAAPDLGGGAHLRLDRDPRRGGAGRLGDPGPGPHAAAAHVQHQRRLHRPDRDPDALYDPRPSRGVRAARSARRGRPRARSAPPPGRASGA